MGYLGLFTPASAGNSVKLIKRYVKQRVKEQRVINNQLEKLNEQLQNETIDKYTYERLRDVLEITYLKQRDEALEKATLKK